MPNFNERRNATVQKLIRTAIEGMADETDGRLTTRGVIATLQDAIDHLEQSALSTDPMSYLEKPES